MRISFGNMTAEVNIFKMMQQPNDMEVEEICMIEDLVSNLIDESFPDDPLQQCFNTLWC